jgi:spore maturation protein CgeB
VFGVGSFLLTRAAEALRSLEAEGALSTFADADDCVGKIKHYLMNEEERERIAARGLQVALRDFNYKDIARKMMDVIAELYTRKSGAKKERQETDASSGAQPADARV